jgi:hypothetical protein
LTRQQKRALVRADAFRRVNAAYGLEPRKARRGIALAWARREWRSRAALATISCGILALFSMGATPSAHAQGSRKDDMVFNAQGRPMAGATVRVCTSGATGQPCAPLAAVYSDAALTQALANPLSTDGMGNYSFYAAPGRYLIEIGGPGITTKQIPNVILPSDPNSPTFTSVTAPNLNNIIFVDGVKYATIPAAIAALPSGGIVDCSFFGATTQTISTTITVPANIVLRCDPATTFQPGTSSVTMFQVMAGAQVSGISVNTNNQGSYTGNVFYFADNYRDDTHTSLHNVQIVSSQITAGSGISIVASNVTSQSVAFVSFTDIRIKGLLAALKLSATGGGFINGNQFQDIHVSYSGYGYYLLATGAGSAISGNQFSNVDYQYGTSATTGIYASGDTSGTVQLNIFSPVVIWDTPTPITIANVSASSNMFIGRWDGTISDSTNLNSYFNQAGLITPSGFSSTNAAANPPVLENSVTSTHQKAIHLKNTGGELWMAVDESSGVAFGSPGYGSVWYSPNNDSYFITPHARFNGQIVSSLAIGTAPFSITSTTPVDNLTVRNVAPVQMLLSPTAPTISSGFGSSPSVTGSNGTAAFRINVGTGGTASSGVIGLPAAANGWNCYPTDITTTSTNVFMTKQTASTTTTATLGNFNTSAVATAWAASDILAVSCFAF